MSLAIRSPNRRRRALGLAAVLLAVAAGVFVWLQTTQACGCAPDPESRKAAQAAADAAR